MSENIKTIKAYRVTTTPVIDVPLEEVAVMPSDEAQIMETERLIEDRAMRSKNISKVEILNKVKSIFILPFIHMVTINQVADYFEVTPEVIRKTFNRHREELEEYGTKMTSVSDFKKLMGHGCHIRSFIQNGNVCNITFTDGSQVTVPNRGIRCFSKTAIFCIGMLLRESRIAQEVRKQIIKELLQTEDQPPEVVTDIVSNINTEIEESKNNEERKHDEEQSLLLDVGKAFATGDIMVFGQAATKLVAFKNRIIASQQNTIKSLETSNTTLMETNSTLTETNQTLRESNALLAEKCLKWTNRQTINRLMRCYANEMYIKFSRAWTILWTELKYRHGISVTQRRAASGRFSDTLVSFIRDDEWKCVEQTFAALLEKDGIDPATFYRRAIPHFDEQEGIIEGEG